MPDKPKFKRKTRKTTANPLKPIPKIIDSETETDGDPLSGDRPRFNSKASISSQDSGFHPQEFEIFSQEEQSTKDVQRSSLVVNHLELSRGSKFSRSISLDSTNEKSSSGVNSLDSRDFGSSFLLNFRFRMFPIFRIKSRNLPAVFDVLSATKKCESYTWTLGTSGLFFSKINDPNLCKSLFI